MKLGGNVQAPRALFTCTTAEGLEFLLPPGRFTLDAYGDDVQAVEVPVEVKPEDREMLLGTIDLIPAEEAKQGLFPVHRRVKVKAGLDEGTVAFRRVHHRALHGEVRGLQDAAFSPDGKIVATAHSSRAGLSEVKLWDWAKNSRIATLTIRDKGVARLAFSPDGSLLSGLGNALAKQGSSSEVVLWDVASRGEARVVGAQSGEIRALAWAPDGKTIATSGADKTTRLWDVATGRETARIGGDGLRERFLLFLPDGRSVAVGDRTKHQDLGPRRESPALDSRFSEGTIYRRFNRCFAGRTNPGRGRFARRAGGESAASGSAVVRHFRRADSPTRPSWRSIAPKPGIRTTQAVAFQRRRATARAAAR